MAYIGRIIQLPSMTWIIYGNIAALDNLKGQVRSIIDGNTVRPSSSRHTLQMANRAGYVYYTI